MNNELNSLTLDCPNRNTLIEPQSFNMEVGFGGRDKSTNIYPVLIQINVEKQPINRYGWRKAYRRGYYRRTGK